MCIVVSWLKWILHNFSKRLTTTAKWIVRYKESFAFIGLASEFSNEHQKKGISSLFPRHLLIILPFGSSILPFLSAFQSFRSQTFPSCDLICVIAGFPPKFLSPRRRKGKNFEWERTGSRESDSSVLSPQQKPLSHALSFCLPNEQFWFRIEFVDLFSSVLFSFFHACFYFFSTERISWTFEGESIHEV